MHLKQNLDFGAGNGESVQIPLVNISVHSEKSKSQTNPVTRALSSSTHTF